MDVKLVSKLPFVFSFIFCLCMWTFIPFYCTECALSLLLFFFFFFKVWLYLYGYIVAFFGVCVNLELVFQRALQQASWSRGRSWVEVRRGRGHALWSDRPRVRSQAFSGTEPLRCSELSCHVFNREPLITSVVWVWVSG